MLRMSLGVASPDDESSQAATHSASQRNALAYKTFEERRGEIDMSHFPLAAAAALALGLIVATIGRAAEERGSAQAPGPGDATALPGARTQDEDFLRTAPGLLAPEIEASKLGVENGRDLQVVALSGSMVQSYTELERKLKDAGARPGMRLRTR